MVDKITKLDAARRQLLAAIHLHWYCNEPIAVYSLASNVWEICDTLTKLASITSTVDRISADQNITHLDVKKLINAPRNFIKHADRDPGAEIDDITHLDCDAVVMTACLDYMSISRRSPAITGLYVFWFAAINPQLLAGFCSKPAKHYFPGLNKADRNTQIQVARDEAKKPLSPELLDSYLNEMSDAWRWKSFRDAHG